MRILTSDFTCWHEKEGITVAKMLPKSSPAPERFTVYRQKPEPVLMNIKQMFWSTENLPALLVPLGRVVMAQFLAMFLLLLLKLSYFNVTCSSWLTSPCNMRPFKGRDGEAENMKRAIMTVCQLPERLLSALCLH